MTGVTRTGGLLAAFILLIAPIALNGQQPPPAAANPAAAQQTPVPPTHPATLDEKLTAGDDEVGEPPATRQGYLNRFDLVGKTQFFQTRIQLQL
jgi:hypothetical protein